MPVHGWLVTALVLGQLSAGLAKKLHHETTAAMAALEQGIFRDDVDVDGTLVSDRRSRAIRGIANPNLPDAAADVTATRNLGGQTSKKNKKKSLFKTESSSNSKKSKKKSAQEKSDDSDSSDSSKSKKKKSRVPRSSSQSKKKKSSSSSTDDKSTERKKKAGSRKGGEVDDDGCQTMIIYRDRNDYVADESYVGNLSNGQPGGIVAISIPFYNADADAPAGPDAIGSIEQIWTWTFNGDGIGHMILNFDTDSGGGQVYTSFTLDCADGGSMNPIVSGTGQYVGIEGYVRLASTASSGGFKNQLTLHYDCPSWGQRERHLLMRQMTEDCPTTTPAPAPSPDSCPTECQLFDWAQLGSDIDGEAAYDYSGASVALSDDGSIVAIGDRANDGNGSNSGHVRVFEYEVPYEFPFIC